MVLAAGAAAADDVADDAAAVDHLLGRPRFRFSLGRMKWDANYARSASLYVPYFSELNTLFFTNVIANPSAVSGLARGAQIS